MGHSIYTDFMHWCWWPGGRTFAPHRKSHSTRMFELAQIFLCALKETLTLDAKVYLVCLCSIQQFMDVELSYLGSTMGNLWWDLWQAQQTASAGGDDFETWGWASLSPNHMDNADTAFLCSEKKHMLLETSSTDLTSVYILGCGWSYPWLNWPCWPYWLRWL